MHGTDRRIVGIVVGIALLFVFGPATLASAATTSKPYSLRIDAGTPTYETAPGEVVASGETVGITATIKNETSTQQLGSANLFWPAGFSASSASVPPPGTASVSTSCTYNGAAAGACVQLRNLSVAPGGQVTVTMLVATPACQQGNGFPWYAEVKQANNYNGSPGNDFSYDATTNSQPDTTLDGACSLQFVPAQEPAAAQTGQPISNTPYTPESHGGAPVAVQVLDSNRDPLTTSTIPVTMSPGTNPFGATLGGTLMQSAVAGTAAFPDLTLNLAGLGYTLVATGGQLGGATSTPFDIQDQTASCLANANCTTTDSPSGVNSSTLVANASGGTGQLVESAFSGTYGQQTLTLCGSSYTSADPYVYESAYTPSSGADRGEVDTTTFTPATKPTGNPQQVLKAQQICFGDAKPFTTASGSPAAPITLPNGEKLYVGLLPTCTGSTVGPCHNRQQDSTIPDKHSKTGYDIVLVDDVPVGWADDPYRM